MVNTHACPVAYRFGQSRCIAGCPIGYQRNLASLANALFPVDSHQPIKNRLIKVINVKCTAYSSVFMCTVCIFKGWK